MRINYNEVHILEAEESRGFVSFIDQDPAVKIEKYVNGGLIAIIVFSIIDIVLIVVLVILFIKMKNKIIPINSLANDEGTNSSVISTSLITI